MRLTPEAIVRQPLRVASELTKAAFAECLHAPFEIELPNGTRSKVELVEVNEGRANARHESFSLLFRGDCNVVHPQATYSMQHATMGMFDIFITPVARNEQGTFYEAVFNRLLDAGS